MAYAGRVILWLGIVPAIAALPLMAASGWPFLPCWMACAFGLILLIELLDGGTAWVLIFGVLIVACAFAAVHGWKPV